MELLSPPSGIESSYTNTFRCGYDAKGSAMPQVAVVYSVARFVPSFCSGKPISQVT